MNAMPQLLYTWERDTIPIVHEAGWVTGPLWIGTEDFSPHCCLNPKPSSSQQVLLRQGPLISTHPTKPAGPVITRATHQKGPMTEHFNKLVLPHTKK